MPKASSTRPDFAVTYTIKDEALLLPDALAWHRALGCRKFYIFLDGTTDAMRQWLPTQPDVEVRETVRAADVVDPPAWIDWVRDNEAGWLDVRKTINSWVAARQAHADGFEWLAMIDPDELVVPNLLKVDDPDGMATLLAGVPASKDQIFLPNCDLLPTGEPIAGPFEQRYFMARLPGPEKIARVLRKLIWLATRSPALEARFEDFFYRTVLGPDMPRSLVDPTTGERLPTGYFLSYSSQKSLFRTARYAAYRPWLHYWRGSFNRRKAWRPQWARVLHYDLVDVDYFTHKFSQRKGTGELAQRRFQVRHLIGQIAVTSSPEEVRRFFRESLCVRDKKRMAELIAHEIVRDLPAVEAFFAQRRIAGQGGCDEARA